MSDYAESAPTVGFLDGVRSRRSHCACRALRCRPIGQLIWAHPYDNDTRTPMCSRSPGMSDQARRRLRCGSVGAIQVGWGAENGPKPADFAGQSACRSPEGSGLPAGARAVGLALLLHAFPRTNHGDPARSRVRSLGRDHCRRIDHGAESVHWVSFCRSRRTEEDGISSRRFLRESIRSPPRRRVSSPSASTI